MESRATGRNQLSTLAIAALIMCWPMVGEATQIMWQLDNVLFEDGGTASGYFIFETDTNSIRTWNIRVEGGSGAFAPLTYKPENSLVAFSSDKYIRINDFGVSRLLQFLTRSTLKAADQPVGLAAGSTEVLSEARRSIVGGSLNGSPSAMNRS